MVDMVCFIYDKRKENFIMSRTWENEYIKNLNDPNVSYYELGNKIEKYRPTKLYRYMKFDDYWKKNVFEGQLFFSSTNTLNDPYDCLVYLNRKIYSKYIIEKLQIQFPVTDIEILKKETDNCFNENLNRYLTELRNNIRITCFAESNLSPLMWSHYADKHQGFCIEYDLSKIDDGYTRCILPVVYSETKCDITDAIISQSTNLLMNPFYYKSKDWEYEKEWRIVIFEDMVKDGEYFADFKQGITGIYLGLGSIKKHKKEIGEILQRFINTDVSVYGMYLDEYTYDLKYKKIN